MNKFKMKFTIEVVYLLVIYCISTSDGSCWRYGHACWGGHGKRADNSFHPRLSSSPSMIAKDPRKTTTTTTTTTPATVMEIPAKMMAFTSTRYNSETGVRPISKKKQLRSSWDSFESPEHLYGERSTSISNEDESYQNIKIGESYENPAEYLRYGNRNRGTGITKRDFWSYLMGSQSEEQQKSAAAQSDESKPTTSEEAIDRLKEHHLILLRQRNRNNNELENNGHISSNSNEYEGEDQETSSSKSQGNNLHQHHQHHQHRRPSLYHKLLLIRSGK